MNETFQNYYQQPQQIKTYSFMQKILLLAVLVLGIVFDRVVIANLPQYDSVLLLSMNLSIFWVVYLGLYTVFTRKNRVKSVESWGLLIASVLLCIHPFIFAVQEIPAINLFLLPFLLMLHAQLNITGKERWTAIPIKWLCGWFIQPFTALDNAVGVFGAVAKGKGTTGRKILLGIAAALPLMLVIFLLLSNADSVFGFYGNRLFEDFDFSELIGHLFVICIVALFFYSFIYNAAWGKTDLKVIAENGKKINDPIVIGIVLSALVLIYALFSYVQFAYLFGSHGLPGGLTYSEYARSGFWQLLFAAAINLGLFALCLKFTLENRIIRVLLVLLLASTGVVLASGIVRLSMYIGAYGLTFFRILPMWFMIYLVALLVLCTCRLAIRKLPLYRLGTWVLVCWYLVLCFANTDAIIASSLVREANGAVLSEQNQMYISSLSDDAVPVMLEYVQKTGDEKIRAELESRLMQPQILNLSRAAAISKIREQLE